MTLFSTLQLSNPNLSQPHIIKFMVHRSNAKTASLKLRGFTHSIKLVIGKLKVVNIYECKIECNPTPYKHIMHSIVDTENVAC